MSSILGRSFAVYLIIAAVSRAGDSNIGIADALAIQDTLRQSRELLSRGETAKAVAILEKQLGKTGGDSAYLASLKEAYQIYVKELQLANKTEALGVYRQRLALLDHKPAPTKQGIARGVRPDDEPVARAGQNLAPANEALGLAERAFAERRFAEARTLFANAGQLSDEHRSQYAYCLLHGVVDRANGGQTAATELQKDVRSAIALAPQDSQVLKFAQQLLKQIGEPSQALGTSTLIKHGDAGNGWKKSESANFRLLHAKEDTYAEQLLRAAEQHRIAAFTKWAVTVSGNWEPLCEICLHVNGASYCQATGQNASSPGHSSIKMPGGKITSRRIELRADNPDLALVTLPHEITHVVLADLFPDGSLPRWADEGMAVLSEPRSQVERYLKTMVRLRTESKLLPLSRILTRTEYPEAATVTVFYVESVSVVEFMVNQKGTAEFVSFLRDAAAGLEPALARHYGYKTITQLEEAWRRAVFTDVDRSMGVGGR